jgi:hypothetical protein
MRQFCSGIAFSLLLLSGLAAQAAPSAGSPVVVNDAASAPASYISVLRAAQGSGKSTLVFASGGSDKQILLGMLLMNQDGSNLQYTPLSDSSLDELYNYAETSNDGILSLHDGSDFRVFWRNYASAVGPDPAIWASKVNPGGVASATPVKIADIESSIGFQGACTATGRCLVTNCQKAVLVDANNTPIKPWGPLGEEASECAVAADGAGFVIAKKLASAKLGEPMLRLQRVDADGNLDATTKDVLPAFADQPIGGVSLASNGSHLLAAVSSGISLYTQALDGSLAPIGALLSGGAGDFRVEVVSNGDRFFVVSLDRTMFLDGDGKLLTQKTVDLDQQIPSNPFGRLFPAAGDGVFAAFGTTAIAYPFPTGTFTYKGQYLLPLGQDISLAEPILLRIDTAEPLMPAGAALGDRHLAVWVDLRNGEDRPAVFGRFVDDDGQVSPAEGILL